MQRVLILPMRNGNAVDDAKIANLNAASSYPTYEEWKPCKRCYIRKDSGKRVLILPMRNGNSNTTGRR